ncbi:MAG: hypothetical protein EBQ82_07390 [Betaproteobacteria bacterium]|nr:hypothetical protein [Betaproteobacteria bacterium]
MSSFFQLFLAWGVLLLVILVLYLIDKINIIYQRHAEEAKEPSYSDGLFGDLVGKALWDAMSGIPLPGFDPKLVQDLKPHYEPVLRQHIEQTFLQGVNDQREGRPGVPVNNRTIPTPRGSVESWMPLHHLSSLYQCGVEHAQNKPADRLRIQQTLDQVCVMLYARTGLELQDPFSRILMEPIDPGAPVTEASTEVPSDAADPAELADASPAVEPTPVSEAAQALATEQEPDVAQPVILGQSLPAQAKPVPA